ncbi:CpaF family protein (plasmid) [Geminicoccaceae bacterium 1502E]|nr:CpaF family protein [Geminicoccaceae bacterium 1502E]
MAFGRRLDTLTDDEIQHPSAEAPPLPEPAAPVAKAATPAAPAAGITLEELRRLCLTRIDPAAMHKAAPEALQADIDQLVAQIADERRLQLNTREQRSLALDLVRDLTGLGPLEPLLADETITDIFVNGPHCIYVEQNGKLQQIEARFRDNAHAANVSQRIASAIGRRIDEASPMVDARLADGSRVNIVFPPLSLQGPCLSIRKFAKRRIDFERLIAFGSMSRGLAKALEIASRCRLNIVVSGGTGSGKTTLLNAMSRLIDPGERIITVEDAAELQLQQPHVVRLETRAPNIEGKGEISQRDLVRNALRMRPDRIIIGEVRGPEAFDMLQAMNTGHDGSMSSVHANNARDAVSRIENMVLMGVANLPARAIRTQIVSAVDLIVQVQRMRDGGRRISQVAEVVGMDGDVAILNDLFNFVFQGEGSGGRLIGEWRSTGTKPRFQDRLEYFGLEKAWAAAAAEE